MDDPEQPVDPIWLALAGVAFFIISPFVSLALLALVPVVAVVATVIHFCSKGESTDDN
jgi:hypothetical protein